MISPADTDSVFFMRQPNAPAHSGIGMSMGAMLPQDGEGMNYDSPVYEYGQQHAQAAYDQHAYGGYEGEYSGTSSSYENASTTDVGDYQRYEDEPSRHEAAYDEPDIRDYDEDAYQMSDSSLAIMPPIGNWYKAGSVVDKERELRRTIANRDNMMVFPLHTLFKIKDLGDREWKLSDVYTKAGEHSPYVFKGSPFDDDRTVKSIFLRDVSQNSPVSVDITASLVHPSSNKETMVPITSYLSSGNEEGPSHLYLRPKESSDKEILLWRKDYSRKIPTVVLENPGVTRRELTKGLNRHPNKMEQKLRTLSRDHLLIRYVKEMIDMGMIAKEENPVEWRSYEGYGIINAHRATTLIDRFINDQAKVLSLRNIWDLRLKLSRGVRSSSSITADEDNAELISEVPVFSHDKKSEVDTYINRLKNIPFNLHWSIQVELESKIKDAVRK
jgi:hypothetical protein